MTLISLIPECFVQSRQFYVTIIGVDGKYIAANDYFLQTFGFTAETIQQIHSIETVHPEDREICMRAGHQCVANPGKPFTVTLRKPTGKFEYMHTRWEFLFFPEDNGTDAYIQCTGMDVTEETRSNQLLNEVKQKVLSDNNIIANLLSNSVDIIILVDEKGTISFCSPNIEREMGYSPDEMIGRTGFEFVHPDDSVAALQIFEAELKNPGANESIDLRFRKKDGTWMWAESKVRNLLTDPLVRGVLINLNDISTRKKTEEALIKSETRYRSFFENLPYPLFLVDPATGRIVNCNKSAEEKYGYTLQELKQMALADLFEEPSDVLQLGGMQQQQIIARHRSKNGDLLIAKLEQYNIQFDENGYRLILTHDITENYKRQQEGQLAFEISSIFMQQAPFNQQLEKALQKIRKFTGWDLIELWVPAYDDSFIRNPVSAFYQKHPNRGIIQEFIELSRKISFTKDTYSQTQLYRTRKPYWVENITDDNTLMRKAIVVGAGFNSYFSTPVITDDKIVCSIFLYSFQQKKRNEIAEKLIVTLGNLIGTELQKRKRERELDIIFKISPDIMTLAGLDGRYLKVNPAFETFTGYSQEEAKGLHPLHYVHMDDRQMVLQKLEELSKGQPVTYFENRVVTKSGEIKWISWTATPVFEEGMVIATHRDITEQKEFEQKLRQSNERYEYAKKATANEAIWDLDIINHEISWSEVFTSMFGYSSLKEDATLGFWEAMIHDEDRQRVSESFGSFLQQTESANWYCEYRFKRADGTYAYIVDRGYMIFDNNHQPIRVVGAMEDISERKKLEEQLILKERIKQKQIAQAAVNAQEKERADIGKELHDNISQMLTSTRLFLDILNNKSPDELLERSIKNINNIIGEVRNVSRSLVPSSIEDLGLIASLNDLMDSVRATKMMEVEFYPDNDIENLIHPNTKLTLYRIVQEQMNNILKHAGAKNVLIELFAENSMIELIVTDDGQGFDITTIKRGLGLKNMRSRTELLNGTIDIKTGPDKGCKLKVQIPYQ
ncbi:MAG: PAS domain S-box protein [Chitinophagaceae bacterium]|nr:PAS domain S-box protein [Chitinophagaceae bacterium]